MKLLVTVLLGAGLMAAQKPAVNSSYLGKTWVGLLVSGSCPAGSKQSAAMQEADRTVGDRVTTPAVDTAGTRGSSEQGNTVPAARGDVPQMGDISVRAKGKIKDAGWEQARRQGSSLDSACRVNSETRSFALLLPDGKILRFADLAGAKISEQLQSRGVSGTGRILRVQVTGKLENGAIALDQIQM